MPTKKKKFIDKKKAVTFHLVHRSQQDPLIADDNAPGHVLVAQPVKIDKNKRLAEQKKFGVYFDDDYDYLQHLKDRGSSSVNHWIPAPESQNNKHKEKINLPSSVFASAVEEDVGLLNKAAPQGLRLDLDPDIVAAMDEDFDFDDPDNILEDDFIQMADGVISGEEILNNNTAYENDEDNSSDQCYSSGEELERYDDVGSLDDDMKSTKSRFTNYSMSSSVIRRNKQLSVLDDTFENMFDEYDDNEIGALDCEDIEGEIDDGSDLLKCYAEEFEKRNASEKLIRDQTVSACYNERSDSESEPDEMELLELKEKEKWDCESILSARSNLYNHPKLITEPSKKIQLDRRGIPVIGTKLTPKLLAQLGDCKPSTGPGSLVSMVSTLSIRPKNETPEERIQRKTALKKYRQDRRMEKKQNSLAFKEEKKKMQKVVINNKINKLMPVL